MRTVIESAFAKLNLTLDIFPRREDGYHPLKTVMQTVSLCDEVKISLESKPGRTLRCTWAEGYDGGELPQGEENLCWKAADAFFARTGKAPEGLSIRIKKRIPMEAGLAGGSSDAAAVLRGLNTLMGEPLDPFTLAEVGAQVGSDVPYCVLGGTALCEGRGEIVTILPPAPKLLITLCKPDFGISTKALYEKIDATEITDRPDNDAMLEALRTADASKIGSLLKNVFEPLAIADHPEIETIKQAMRSCGALGTQMTGSGSAVFGIFNIKEDAEAAARALSGKYKTFLAVSV